MAHITTWAPPSVRSAEAVDSHKSVNPTVNCICERSRLQSPYENLMPDDLSWSWGGEANAGSGCKHRLSLAERSDRTETIINQLLADLHQNPISEWLVKTSSGLPLILHYGELYNYFIIYYNVIIIGIKCTINVMHLNHPETILPPGLWKNCLPWNRSLVPKRLGTAALEYNGFLWQGSKVVENYKLHFNSS